MTLSSTYKKHVGNLEIWVWAQGCISQCNFTKSESISALLYKLFYIFHKYPAMGNYLSRLLMINYKMSKMSWKNLIIIYLYNH